MKLAFAFYLSRVLLVLTVQRGSLAFSITPNVAAEEVQQELPGQSVLTRIVGGNESVPHSRPYMAVIQEGIKLYGGTLIKSNWVLTAAHCFEPKETHIILGAHNRTHREKEQQIMKIAKQFIYPGFNDNPLEHDIALLKLQKKAVLNHSVTTIKLPLTTDDVKEGTTCLVTGWGSTYYDGKPTDTLHEANVTVFDRNNCNNTYRNYPRFIVTKNMLCAGDKIEGRDLCWGDSGGPLICNGEQRGIVSFGACGSWQYPGVYTRLTEEYLRWIKQTIHDHS